MKKKGDRVVTEGEKRLWRFITRDDLPLPKDGEDDSEAAGDEFDIDLYASQQTQNLNAAPIYTPPKPASVPIYHTLREGDYRGVDGRNADRIRKGKRTPDVRIDLHGHSQIDAYARLAEALPQAASAGKRLVLVITGKGRTGDGVLRHHLPFWLNVEAIRPFVLAFDRASPKDGGEGAFYVLLKRQRQSEKPATPPRGGR